MSKRETSGGRLDRVALGVHGSKTSMKRVRRLLVETDEGIKDVSQEDLIAGLVKRTAVETTRANGRETLAECLDCGAPILLNVSGRRTTRCDRHARLAIERRWRAKNPEKVLAKVRRQYHKDVEKSRASGRRSRAKHAEKRAAYEKARAAERRAAARKRRASHPERYREKSRAWRETNAERVREQKRQSRNARLELERERDRKRYAAKRAKAGFSVPVTAPAVRPTSVQCRSCSAELTVKARGVVPSLCKPCHSAASNESELGRARVRRYRAKKKAEREAAKASAPRAGSER